MVPRKSPGGPPVGLVFVLFVVILGAFALAYLGLHCTRRTTPTATVLPPARIIILRSEPPTNLIPLATERQRRRPYDKHRPPDGGGAGAQTVRAA